MACGQRPAPGVRQAVGLVLDADGALWPIVALSLQVSGLTTLIAATVALPLAASLALAPFHGRGAVVAVFNALMGLPAVVVGLIAYLLLSRAGPLGPLGLLFTPVAMVVAQSILVLPLIAALARQTLEDTLAECGPYLGSLGASRLQTILTLLWAGRFSLFTTVLAGFGRAAADVGAVMMVGGNIDGVTRVKITAIALETSKGDLPLALGLGLVLLAVVVIVNACALSVRQYSPDGAGRARHRCGDDDARPRAGASRGRAHRADAPGARGRDRRGRHVLRVATHGAGPALSRGRLARLRL
jgi:tungstate transport system permease protein